jgi:hypothetical protein
MHINIQQAAARGIQISIHGDYCHIEFDGATNNALLDQIKGVLENIPGTETLNIMELERILEDTANSVTNSVLLALLKQIG